MHGRQWQPAVQHYDWFNKCCRFERPDSRNRWDAPLFTVHPLLGQDHIQRQLEAVVLALTDEAAGGPVSRMQQGPVAKQLVPNIATDCGPGAAGEWPCRDV